MRYVSVPFFASAIKADVVNSIFKRCFVFSFFVEGNQALGLHSLAHLSSGLDEGTSTEEAAAGTEADTNRDIEHRTVPCDTVPTTRPMRKTTVQAQFGVCRHFCWSMRCSQPEPKKGKGNAMFKKKRNRTYWQRWFCESILQLLWPMWILTMGVVVARKGRLGRRERTSGSSRRTGTNRLVLASRRRM